MVQGTALKAKLRAGELCRGAWLSVPSPAVVDSLAHAGFDFLYVETEHAPLTIESVEWIALLCRHAPAVPIVRVGLNDQVEIKRALDVGAEGVLVPMVNTAEDAARAVSYAKYPPQGMRGVAPRAAAEFGRKQAEYLRTANDRTIVIPQIETVEALQNVDEIVGVPGIDAVFVGPTDLSASMGYLGQPDHPEVEAALDHVIARATARGVPVATITRDPDDAVELARRGAQMLTLGSDYRFMLQAATAALAKVPPDSFRRGGAPGGAR